MPKKTVPAITHHFRVRRDGTLVQLVDHLPGEPPIFWDIEGGMPCTDAQKNTIAALERALERRYSNGKRDDAKLEVDANDPSPESAAWEMMRQYVAHAAITVDDEEKRAHLWTKARQWQEQARAATERRTSEGDKQRIDDLEPLAKHGKKFKQGRKPDAIGLTRTLVRDVLKLQSEKIPSRGVARFLWGECSNLPKSKRRGADFYTDHAWIDGRAVTFKTFANLVSQERSKPHRKEPPQRKKLRSRKPRSE